MPKVYNKKYSYPLSAIYIGRGSPWGNHHRIGWCEICNTKHDRTEAIKCFEKDLLKDNERLKVVKTFLKDKDLVCYCKPLDCHGDILMRIANEDI